MSLLMNQLLAYNCSPSFNWDASGAILHQSPFHLISPHGKWFFSKLRTVAVRTSSFSTPSGMNDQQIMDFQKDIAKMGYVWQFITLAGFNMDSLMATRFARDYEKCYMLTYVEMIQRPERSEKVETLIHQKWRGRTIWTSTKAWSVLYL